MRYKSIALDRINNIENQLSRITFELNRNLTREAVENSIETLKEQISDLKQIITNEHDTFNEQFK